MVANSISSFGQFPNYLKGYNPRAAHILLLTELILDDTPKGLTLVPNHRTKVLTFRSLLHRVWQHYMLQVVRYFIWARIS